ncbi:hypothetical protein E2986_13272 [Frieseomelitta varia]|uniref:DH domain-containing protein n=1 Tax=Frieseomelitta varia TaxID=561572 RepID=A0A833WEF9_9HYME|nr:hypothetical protein E2986_13272 [Frieseomelitta varia]
MENTVLRKMNLNSFLMVPVRRVTKYPLLLARLLKATSSVRSNIQEAKERLKQAQATVELHLDLVLDYEDDCLDQMSIQEFQ